MASLVSPRQYEIFAKPSQGGPCPWTKNVSFAKDHACSACIEGKLHEKVHPPMTIIYSKRPLEPLHLDLFGPPSFDSLGGRKYCLVIVDDYSRYTWVYFFKRKSETQQTIIQDTLGYISSRGRVRLNKPSSTVQMKLNVNMMQRS